MLWYKGWLETRFRMLFMFLFAIFPISLMILNSHPAKPSTQDSFQAMHGIVEMFALYYSIIPLALAGSGIKTQSAFQRTKGLHGSMYFTLSMPVSRFRLLATRVGLGMLEVAAVLTVAPCGVWILFPSLRMHITGTDLFEYWVTLLSCALGLHFLGVLLSTVLDDVWQTWISIFGLLFLRWLLSTAPLPKAMNIFRAMSELSPLFTHSLPWSSMGISLGAAAVLFLIAKRVVETREY